jgi:hypothetical protein
MYCPGEFIEVKESLALSLMDNMIRIYKGETP